MKQTAVEWLGFELNMLLMDVTEEQWYKAEKLFEQAKEVEEKNLLEMLHKFGFDYTYNYKGEKTIYEWIPEWFEEYKTLNKI